MLIYTPYLNDRFRYATSMLLDLYKGEIEYTQDITQFGRYDGPKIFYGNIIEGQSFPVSIPETPWMWDDHIHAKLPAVKSDGGFTRLFFTESENWDVVSAVFWMLSRYEEYIALKHDRHGRFMPASSVLGWDNDTRKPWVDIWRREFQTTLLRCFPSVQFHENRFSIRMTVDVDSAFAYRHKGLVRTVGAMVKDVFRGQFANLYRRSKTVLLARHDPYDTYAWIAERCLQHKVPLTWFFLLADRTKEDIGLSHENKQLRMRILDMAKNFPVGIHPGYASHEDESRLQMEVKRLQNITGKPVTISRQHYLKMSLPETYDRLIACGIREDFTMGFAQNIGFRAGTNRAFPWFNLKQNANTELMIHPFAVMDTTLRDYMKLEPDEAIESVQRLIGEVKDFGGEMNFLWHNESVSEIGKWQGWSVVFEEILNSK